MIEKNVFKKSKINLNDYDVDKDIKNRLLLSTFSYFDKEVLEEILYSPLKIEIINLAFTLDVDISKLIKSLEKISKTDLIKIENETIFVNKKTRSYYEFEIKKFEKDFKPDINFLFGLLKKIPINIIPIWYSLPKTSNDILESLIEKYLKTPQKYLRHIHEIEVDPIIKNIIEELLDSKDFVLTTSDIKSKYNLTDEEFIKISLFLEFNFISFISYRKVKDDILEEVLIPLYEWTVFQTFLRETESKKIKNQKSIVREKSNFLKDFSDILKDLKNKQENLKDQNFNKFIKKAKILKFIDKNLKITKDGKDWLKKDLEKKSLSLYHHPENGILDSNLPENILTYTNFKEAAKSLERADSNWIFFDDFIKGITISLNSKNSISLEKKGKFYKYSLPVYSQEEKDFVKQTIFLHLYELGFTEKSKKDKKDCFRLTCLGQKVFES